MADLEKVLCELKETREAVIRQERLAAVGELAAGIAHEYNNMMMPVILFSDLLLQNKEIDPSAHQKLAVIRDQGQQAADLTQQILDLSRKAVLNRKRLNLNELEQDRKLAFAYASKKHWCFLFPWQLAVFRQW